MNTKTKLFSLAVAILFLNVFFVLFDGSENIAKASTCSECITYCQQYGKAKSLCRQDDCLRACTIVMPGGGPVIYTREMCKYYYGPNYVPTKDGTACKRSSGGDDSEGEDGSGGLPPGETGLPAGFVPGEIDDGQNCNSDSSCTVYDCCPEQLAEKISPDASDEQIKENEENKIVAESASSEQELAYDEYMKALETLANCGNDEVKCQEARIAVENARKRFEEATARAEEAIARYNASFVVVFPSFADTGAGFLLCANGLLAKSCKDGSQGTPFLKGISSANEKPKNVSTPGFFSKLFAWPTSMVTFSLIFVIILGFVQYAQKGTKKLKRSA